MMYKKPKDVTYTQMAIYIDNHIYSEKYDPLKVYSYIYLLAYMLAVKQKYFTSARDYDEFSVYVANKAYMRLTKPNQVSEEEMEEISKNKTGKSKQLKRIKSILNYLKNILYAMKVDYQKESFRMVYNPEYDPKINIDGFVEFTKQSITSSYSGNIANEVRRELQYLPQAVKKVLDTTPYKNNKVYYHKLYMSCLLTLLSSLTLNNQAKERIEHRLDKGMDSDDILTKLYYMEKIDSTIIWHLNPNMKDYIYVLCNRVRKSIVEDILSIMGSYHLTDDMMLAIMLGDKKKVEGKDYD